jgi:G3E family GTPase
VISGVTPGVIPTLIVGGYLGAGKTTLVNHLLRERGGRRLAILVNDFGDIAIDQDLIESTDGPVQRLAGGCICCSFGSDLVGALLAMPAMEPRPDHILIETSGVAIPGMVAQAVRLVQGLVLDAVLVLADASTLRARAGDAYVGDTVQRQLRDADLVLLNKIDLVDPPELERLCEWLQALTPRARVVPVQQARLATALVLDAGGAAGVRTQAPADAPGMLLTGGRLQPPPPSAQQLFDSISMEFEGPVDCQKLAAAFGNPQADLVRAKGLMTDNDGTARALQLVGTRCTVVPSSHPHPESGRLVCIALKGRLDRAWVAQVLADAGARQLRARDAGDAA